MNPEDVLPFVSRDWAAAAASTRAYWADRYRQEGWRATWNAADALLEDARRTVPGYPREEDRARDLADHVAFRHLLNTIDDALARR